MRNLLTIILACALLLLTACGGDAGNNGTGRSPDSSRNTESADIPSGSSSEQSVQDREKVSAPQVQDTGQSGEYLSIEKSVFSKGETITVTTTGITDEMEAADAFVAIYNAGAEHHEYRQYLYPQAGDDALDFTAPSADGKYELRLYRQDYVYTDDTFVESIPFAVGVRSGSATGDDDEEEEEDDITGDASPPGQSPGNPDSSISSPPGPGGGNQAGGQAGGQSGGGETGGGATDGGSGVIDGIPGRLHGNTYSWICEEGINKITMVFSDSTFYLSIAVNGEIAIDGVVAYEIKGNMMIGTDENGNVSEGEFKLEGDKLTLYNFLFNEDLVLTRE